MFSAPSVDFGDVARGPQGVTAIEAGDVGSPLMTNSGQLHSARGT